MTPPREVQKQTYSHTPPSEHVDGSHHCGLAYPVETLHIHLDTPHIHTSVVVAHHALAAAVAELHPLTAAEAHPAQDAQTAGADADTDQKGVPRHAHPETEIHQTRSSQPENARGHGAPMSENAQEGYAGVGPMESSHSQAAIVPAESSKT